jgi:hypothetical protein
MAKCGIRRYINAFAPVLASSAPDFLLRLRIRPKKGVFVGNLRNDPDAAESRPELVRAFAAEDRDSVSRLNASLPQPPDDGLDLLLG